MRNEKRKIILIGGAPTTGKSTIAQLVAKKLSIPWISTDQIREIMRTVARRTDFPKLFNPEGYTAERFLNEFSAEQIVKIEMDQGEAVWPIIKKFIQEDYTWEEGFIVEGIGLLPHLIAKDLKNKKNIRAVFLVDENADRIRHVVFTRGLWDDAHTYSDDVKEREVEWASLFSHKIKKEAEKYSYPCIEVKKSKDDLQAVLKALR